MKNKSLKFYADFRIYIFPSVVALCSLILIIFVIYPQTVKLIQNQKVESSLLEKSNLLEAKAESLESIDEEDLAEKVDYVLTSYPVERDYAESLGLLQSISAKSGFSLISLSVQQGAQSTQDKSYNISVEAVGPKSLLPQFIDSIESSIRLMKVANIEVVPPRGLDAAKVHLGIQVLFAPAPTSFGNAESPLPTLSDKDQELLIKLASSKSSVGFTPSSGRGKLDPFQ